MRELRFRAWVNDNGNRKLFYVAEIDLMNKWVIIQDTKFMFEESVVEQYTGIKDKNGKEIYEGDIVSTGSFSGKVFMRLGCWYVEKVSELGYLRSPQVVGNIHEE